MRQGIKWNGGEPPALVQSKVVCGTETLFVLITYFSPRGSSTTTGSW